MADESNGIITRIAEICEAVCDNYCKYPAKYGEKYKDEDEAANRLYVEKCMHCPIDEMLSRGGAT